MMTLTAPLSRRFDWIDQLVSDVLRTPLAPRNVARVEASRGDDGLTLTYELPGVAETDIEITATGQALAVAANRTRNGETETIRRSVTLHDSYDLDQLVAQYTNGLLTLMIPVKEAAKPRKVELTTAPSPAITAAEAPAEVPAVEA